MKKYFIELQEDKNKYIEYTHTHTECKEKDNLGFKNWIQ